MALRDVKEYYYTMLGQYVEMKDDLADFEQAFQNGYITEDRLETVQQDIAAMKGNLDRIQYIMYLWELPNRKQKQAKYRKNPANKKLEAYFEEKGVSLQNIEDENASTLIHLRKELESLK